ncbi:MAG: metal-dependent hydrolase [Psychrobacillus sp.]
MTGNTHIIGGLAASLAISQMTDYDPVLLVVGGVVGAIIPDICHGGSMIGRRFPLISKIINKVFGHRSFTHSLLFILLLVALMNYFSWNKSIMMGVSVGVASHLLLDMATKNGVKLFFPLPVTVRFPITTRTGGTVESIVFGILSVLTVYFGYGAFHTYF